MVAALLGVAMSLECSLGIRRSWEPASPVNQVCSLLVVGERTLPRCFPCNWKFFDTNVSVFLPGSLRGGDLKQGYELWIQVPRYLEMTEKRKLWQWLNVTKKLVRALQWPFFLRVGFVLSVAHILWGYQMVQLLWVSRRISDLLKLEFEGGFSCSFSYEWFRGPPTNNFAIVEKWKGISIF